MRPLSGQLRARLLLAVQHGGSSYLSNTRIRGVFALRGCVLNYRTTKHDMDILLDAVSRIGAELIGH